MVTMIEKVARAICFADGTRCCPQRSCAGTCEAPWENLVQAGREKEARGAIAAMRDPSEEMLETATSESHWGSKICYRAMIDTALGQTSR